MNTRTCCQSLISTLRLFFLLLIILCTNCQNGGICTSGICDCPEGFLGTNCEIFDLTKIQELLDAGQSPKTIFDGGAPLEDLYGKMYNEGLIFYLDTISGSGLVTATEDQSSSFQWGCNSEDIIGLPNIENIPPMSGLETEEGARLGDGPENTDKIILECSSSVAQLCRDLGEEWFLPSREELNLMYNNLHRNGHASFDIAVYWSSTEYDELSSWSQGFGSGVQFDSEKVFFLNVRATKTF